MSALQLDFKFEDKLKKFIEENCPYNFEIQITKTQSGVEIKDGTPPDIVQELNHIWGLVDDITYDDWTEEIEGKDEAQEAIDNLLNQLNV